MPPQLEKNHVVPTAWQDEALARDGISREVPCSPQTTFHSVCQAIFSTEHGLLLSRFLPVSPAGLGMVVVHFCCPWLQATGALPVISAFTFHFHALEEEMATHSSVLAWRIPGMGEPGGLPSMGSHRVGHD